MNSFSLLISLICISLITACESDQDTRLQDSLKLSTVGVTHEASFDPANSVIPFPNNLLFKDTTDATLNIPVPDANDFTNPQVALNTLDGFSTTAPMSTSFSTSVDSSTVLPATVRVFQVTLAFAGGPVGVINSELVFGVDFVATLSSVDTSNSTLAILPLIPLAEKSSYFVVLTNGVKASDGKAFRASTTYALAKSATTFVVGGVSQLNALSDEQAIALEPLRLLTNVNEGAAFAFDNALVSNDIILSWAFTTQSIGDVLAQVQTDVATGAIPVTVLNDSNTDSKPNGNADIFVGTITLPYFLTAAANPQDTAPKTKFWRAADGSFLTQFSTPPAPAATNPNLTIPLMMSIPKIAIMAKPAGGWKTVIFLHGITANRSSMLAVADSLAAAGFAVVAIDMPLHGITGAETNGTQNFKTAFERHFDLDIADNGTGAPGADGAIDSSGSHFINLKNLLVSRDNVRQGVSDLFNLTKALEGMDYDTGGADFDLTNIYFVGHSLGGIIGSTYLAIEPSVKSAVLGMSGGGIAKLLDGSATFGSRIAGGLFVSGVVKGTAQYESFMGAAQTVLDSGDPINYTADITAGRGILLFEVVGGSTSPSDLVIPNKVPDGNDIANTVPGPLSGTDPIATLMSLTKFSTDQAAANLKAWVRFTVGSHASLLSPNNAAGIPDATSASVTTEMQTQMATFLASDGSVLNVDETLSILAPP